ncbi:MAG: hypothetical protein KUG82_18735 [Pseudomonadales bacterium]|nr:hypothetical protein [Pseudomonadales bacterium]
MKVNSRSLYLPLILSITSISLFGCGGSDAPQDDGSSNRNLDKIEATPEDRSKQVVVIVHGNAGGMNFITASVSSFGFTFGGSENDGEFVGHRCSDGIIHYADSEIDPDEEGLAQWIADEGYDVWFANYTSNSEVTDPVPINAACLGRQIGEVAQFDEDGKVTIIAGSLGGVVSRYYLEGGAEDYPYQNNVEDLITLGTPHKGMPLDILSALGLLDCDIKPAYCSLSNRNMETFNQSHDRAEGVVYNFIGGATKSEYILEDFTSIARIISILGDNDGLASTSSALGENEGRFDYEIEGRIGRFETDESHAPNIGINSYYVPRVDLEGNQTAPFSTSFEDCIKPQLAGEVIYCGND